MEASGEPGNPPTKPPDPIPPPRSKVLLKTVSGFSDTASVYSAGVKLVHCCAEELVGVQPPPIEYRPVKGEQRGGLSVPARRAELLCQLRAHLRWKAKHEARRGRPRA